MVEADGRVNFGWFSGPIKQANLGDLAAPHPGSPLARVPKLRSLERRLRRLRLKRWHLCMVGDADLLLAVGVVDLGYLGGAFAWVVEAAAGRVDGRSLIAPFGRGLHFASNGVEGGAALERAGARIVLADECALGRRHISLLLPAARGVDEIAAEVSIADDLLAVPPLVLLSPLPGGRASYTHRVASLPARGALRVGRRRHTFGGALAALDWGLAYPERHTAGRWAAAGGGGAAGAPVGLILAGVGSDEGASALWVAGRPTRVEHPTITRDRGAGRSPWRMTARDGRVGLTFAPLAVREARLRLGLVGLSVATAFGRYEGKVVEEDGSGHLVRGILGIAGEYDAWG